MGWPPVRCQKGSLSDLVLAPSSACNGRAHMGMILQLIEQHMWSAPIDDMHAGHVGQSIQTGRDFRDHPPVNDAFLDQCLSLCLVEFCKVSAISQVNAIHITQKDEP